MSVLHRGFFALCLLTSCMVSMSKQEQTQFILQPPSIEQSPSPFIAGDWPARQWWEQYGLDELNELVEQALCCNPTIQAARARIDYASAQSVIAHSKLCPLIYFVPDDQLNYLSYTGLYRVLNPTIPISNNIIDFSLSFFYEFDFWGKYHNFFFAAIGRERTATAEAAQAELIASTALAQAYFALRTNLIRKALYEELYAVRKGYDALRQKLLLGSLDALLLPLLSEEAVYEAKQWVDAINQEIATNIHLVNILAGRGPDEPLACCQQLCPLPETLPLPTDLSIQLLARRPDLMAQRWKMEALACEVGAAKAEFLPDVNILAFLGFQSTHWSTLFDWISKTVTALPAISMPIYTAGAIGANVVGKKALFYEAVFEYNDLILKSFQQVTDLVAIGQAVYDEKKQQEGRVASSLSRYQLTCLRQQKGLDSGLTAYQFQEEVIRKQLEDVQLLYQQYVVNISLIRALGGGYFCAGSCL